MLKRTLYAGANVFFLVAAIAIFMYLTVSIGGRTIQLYRLQGDAGRLREDIVLLKEQNRQLSERRQVVSSDDYIEKVAREELGMARPDDKAVIILSQDGGPSQSDKENSLQTDSRPFWQQWWDLLFGADKPPS